MAIWTIAAGAGQLQLDLAYDQRRGALGMTAVTAFGKPWLRASSLAPMLHLTGVRVDDGPTTQIDGTEGLRLERQTPLSLVVVHEASGLRLTLSYAAADGPAIVQSLALENARREGVIRIASATTLAWTLDAGDWLETLGADDGPGQWTPLDLALPVDLGYEGLRNGRSGMYPLATLSCADGHGLTIAVDSATGWRIAADETGGERRIRAGEFQSELLLEPGERADLPDVVALFSGSSAAGGPSASVHAYLEAVSPSRPRAWQTTSPCLFNTWFAYGTDLFDDGAEDSPLRVVARRAAEVGIEVLVIDAGWYLGNPQPTRRDGVNYTWADDFTSGLGTWVESPAKWQARAGDGGSAYAGLRNFSDYVHGLDVRLPDSGVQGKLKLGLWFEPERFDPNVDAPERMPPDWAIPFTTIVDFSRRDVVDGMHRRIQEAIGRYRVDYVKIDANADLASDPVLHRQGHFWTRYSQGFQRFLAGLRGANPDVYFEHCAAGLQRFWIGMPRVADSTWLDDHISAETVGGLLDATEALLLPRQKTVLVKEDFRNETPAGIADLVRTYWGDTHRNGGALGISNRIEQLSPSQRDALAAALYRWKTEVRPGA